MCKFCHVNFSIIRCYVFIKFTFMLAQHQRKARRLPARWQLSTSTKWCHSTSGRVLWWSQAMASKAFAVLIGRKKSSEYLMSVVNIQPVDNWVVRCCWRGYLSGVRCILSSWRHCHSLLSLASVWYQLTWVEPDREPLLDGCCCCCCVDYCYLLVRCWQFTGDRQCCVTH